MTDPDALVAFLRARLDERAGRRLHHHESCPGGWASEDTPYAGAPCVCGTADEEAQIIREVDAQRRIVDECAGDDESMGAGYYLRTPEVTDGLNLRILSLLALPFSTHPDYREEWAPDA